MKIKKYTFNLCVKQKLLSFKLCHLHFLFLTLSVLTLNKLKLKKNNAHIMIIILTYYSFNIQKVFIKPIKTIFILSKLHVKYF